MTLPFKPAYLWVDLQMSGLNPHYHKILEFACVLTDAQLKYKQEGPHLIIHCDSAHLQTMDQWCTRHHSQSGLTFSCLNSKTTAQQAEEYILQYLTSLGIKQGELVLAGNSVHVDKMFLMQQMPKLNAFVHYRILDVSSVKIVVNSTKPRLFYKKRQGHRALDDIRQSIAELQYYMTKAFS